MEMASMRRWVQSLNRFMPVALDVTGLMLLSGSAMMWNLIAGTAVAGISCFVLNWRCYGGK